VRSALHLGWDADVPLGAILAGRLGGELPVRVENDSAMVVLAEYHRGAGQRVHTLLILGCEHTGIGLAGLVNVLGPDRVVFTGLLGERYGIAPGAVSARLSVPVRWWHGPIASSW
jgi:predicted NBD/HSP70 family sugar kinase